MRAINLLAVALWTLTLSLQSLYAQTPPSTWPGDSDWKPLRDQSGNIYFDPNDNVNGQKDLVGDATNGSAYLYNDGTDYVFMNTTTYDQVSVPPAALGTAVDYLVEQMMAQISFYNGEIIGVEIAPSVELEIAQTEPGLQGDRSSGGTKPATLVTGKEIKVPLFIDIGDTVRVDTRTGDYMTRV